MNTAMAYVKILHLAACLPSSTRQPTDEIQGSLSRELGLGVNHDVVLSSDRRQSLNVPWPAVEH